MDTIKIGKFIAELRREKGCTQEALGEVLGVSGKTVSRWETGTYLPPVEMLQLLSTEFGVSINELLSGQRLDDSEFKVKADENLVAMTKESAFTIAEKKAFLIEKWRRDHRGLLILLLVLGIIAWVIPAAMDKTYLFGLSALFNIAEFGWRNNKMMAYAEEHLYGR